MSAAGLRRPRRRARGGSSSRWLQRQQRDPLVRRAKEEGYRARSVYKLEEIDRRFRLLRKGMRVVDLGAAPGSWSQYAASRGCRVVAVDRLPMRPVTGVAFLEGDFLEETVRNRLREMLGGECDLVLSDLAPDATGRRTVDRLRAEAAAEEVLRFACRVLRPGGGLLLKLLHGADALVTGMARPLFARCRLVRPAATRRDSTEIYLVGTGFRGRLTAPPGEEPDAADG